MNEYIFVFSFGKVTDSANFKYKEKKKENRASGSKLFEEYMYDLISHTHDKIFSYLRQEGQPEERYLLFLSGTDWLALHVVLIRKIANICRESPCPSDLSITELDTDVNHCKNLGNFSA